MRAGTFSLIICPSLCLIPALSGQQNPPAHPDYSQEAYIFEKFATKLQFSADGNGTREVQVTVRVQSEAAVRSFGVVGSTYKADTESFDIPYARVRKPDGRVIETLREDIQDLPTEVTRQAPMYSDIREKQLPVKGLGAGDTLEYELRWSTLKPEIPGQFWYTHEFIRDGVVLEETLEIRVPAAKYATIDSPRLQPQVRQENGQKTYFWKTARLQRSALEPTKASTKNKDREAETARVQITTFHDWAEVGRWYEKLESDRIAITPAIQAKAAELTASLQNDADKERAIYNYVSTNFRYISISFGSGRYQSHTAAEVLANQYGDCKDKHTLFAALLKAANVEAWPALIGAGIKLDPNVPSPAQFNHLITVVPERNGYLWLDTTPEVAPFGLLSPAIRDEQALVIPRGRPAVLMTTPQDPIFRTSDRIEAKGALDFHGTLTAHFELTLHSDIELYLRTAFHETAPAQWHDLVQNLVKLWGYAGEVSNVTADNPENLDKPFHLSYDYKRDNYSDWENLRITLPIAGFDIASADDTPKEPVSIGAAGESVYAATIQLPKGYSAEIPANTKLHTDFADYSATYSVSNGALSAERRLVINKSRPPLTGWHDYVEFGKSIRNDETQYISLASSENTASATLPENNPEAVQLIQQAVQAIRDRDMNTAADALKQAEQLNPKQIGLNAAYGYLYLSNNEMQKGIESLQKEIQLHPENTVAYQVLSQVQRQAGHLDDAIETMHLLASRNPADIDTVLKYTSLLMQSKRYADILSALKEPLAATSNNARLQGVQAEALLRTNHKEEGLALAKILASANPDPRILNDLAYTLTETKSDLALAREYAEKAVSGIENALKDLKLSNLTNEDLRRVSSLAAAWDTLGWAYYELGDHAKAEAYLQSAWKLTQDGIVADHLGQLYDREGKHQQAIHMWRLALAANGKLDETRDRLRNAGASTNETRRVPRAGNSVVIPNDYTAAPEELGKKRTSGVPSLPKQTASAEFFLLFSPAQIEDVQFISGKENLKDACAALREAHYDMTFPDQGPEKIPRRAILSCSELTTPSCQITLLLPATTTK